MCGAQWRPTEEDEHNTERQIDQFNRIICAHCAYIVVLCGFCVGLWVFVLPLSILVVLKRGAHTRDDNANDCCDDGDDDDDGQVGQTRNRKPHLWGSLCPRLLQSLCVVGTDIMQCDTYRYVGVAFVCVDCAYG